MCLICNIEVCKDVFELYLRGTFFCFVGIDLFCFYRDSFHFKYLCLVNGSAFAVFSYKYAGLYNFLAAQIVTSQFSLFICNCLSS